MKTPFTIVLFLMGAWLLQGCMADIRTPLIEREGITASNTARGKMLLEKAWKKQGLDQLQQHRTYSFQGKDVWKGLMGKLGKPWPEAKVDLQFRYVIGTFDSQVSFLSGSRTGERAGLQSWRYYEVDPEGTLTFTDYNERIGFGLSAYQYFFELPDRLLRAPIISYAGEREFRGQWYDQVFVSWEQPEPHREHDQYVLWINRETGLLEFALYTLRETYLKMPGASAFYGSIQFADWQDIDGILIPHRQIVYLNRPKKKPEQHLHQLEIRDFAFDDFPQDQLYPDPALERLGDDKLVSGN